MSDIELWAGAECTVNRVGERWFDQVCRTGHHDREDDMDRLAALGVSRVRFPVVWERVAPQGLDGADWSWTDARLSRLASLGIAPIVGLVHHGSGPAGIDLADPGFVDGLAAFAEAVARRYPWVRDFTPVNEPLTTARFGALYGHWYPHARNTSAFLQALLHQVRATALAMQRIREVIPEARLVQTEDLGRVSSTPALEEQRRYESARRWLSLDLLTGRVDADHPLRLHLEQHGVPVAELDALVERPCPPDVVGINYYLTSDRHLDERLELYPPCHHGGNGWQRYADVEAVRVGEVGIAGHRALLEEVWQRYAIPVAITEVHLGCTREEQLRWVHDAWRAAVDARAGGGVRCGGLALPRHARGGLLRARHLRRAGPGPATHRPGHARGRARERTAAEPPVARRSRLVGEPAAAALRRARARHRRGATAILVCRRRRHWKGATDRRARASAARGGHRQAGRSPRPALRATGHRVLAAGAARSQSGVAAAAGARAVGGGDRAGRERAPLVRWRGARGALAARTGL